MNLKIVETRDFLLLEKLAYENGQESAREATENMINGWFVTENEKIVGGCGLFRWKNDYVLDYLFTVSNEEDMKTLLVEKVIEFLKKNTIKTIYFIRDETESKFYINNFGFKKIPFKDLPSKYRDFTFSMCEKCPSEIKKSCRPVGLVLDLIGD